MRFLRAFWAAPGGPDPLEAVIVHNPVRRPTPKPLAAAVRHCLHLGLWTCLGLSGLAGNAHAAPKWVCTAGNNGKWLCGDGSNAPARARTPKPQARAVPARPKSPGPVIQAAPQPSPARIERDTRSPEPGRKPERQADTGPTAEAARRQATAEPQAEVAGGPVGKAPTKRAAVSTQSIEDTGAGQRCPSEGPVRTRLASLRFVSSGRVDIEADGVEYFLDERTVAFLGDVQARDGDALVSADRVDFDQNADLLTASGSVRLDQPGLEIQAEVANIQPGAGQATLDEANFLLSDSMLRGSAKQARLDDSRKFSSYDQVAVTTCPPGVKGWKITADSLDLDHAAGKGTARNAKVRFLGLPLGSIRSLTFPIDERRQSGFLPPAFGYSDDMGAAVSAPYYLNLAPNYDLTLTPTAMSKRGVLLGAEFRFLTERTHGELSAEVVPYDFKDETTRGALGAHTFTQFTDHVQGRIDARWVSSDDYFDLYRLSQVDGSRRVLEQLAELAYHNDWLSAWLRVQAFQTLDATITSPLEPYSRLPQLLVRAQRELGMALVDVRGEFVHFERDTGVTGQRIDLMPTVSVPVRRPWGFVIPRAGVRYTGYNLDNPGVGMPSSPDRLLPVASIDAGLVFERESTLFGGSTQTLEPRIYYLYVGHENQDDLPVFDTVAYDYDFATLFRDNSFSGPDRVENANRVAIALTTRVLEHSSGMERLAISIGQIFRFEDSRIALPGTMPDGNDSTALVLEARARISRALRLSGGIEYNLEDDLVNQTGIRLVYHEGPLQRFSAGFRERRGVLSQTEVSGIWPISRDVRLIGRWNYSLRHDQTLEVLGGFEYSQCCWKVRLVARDRVDQDSKHNLGVMLQLVLNGLGSFGNDIDSFLERGISGYRLEDDFPL